MKKKLKWDQIGERCYETGVDKGVLYVIDETGAYGDGVAWSGLASFTENPSGAEAKAVYADNMKYLNLISAEDFGGKITAYTYPAEFERCDGSAEIIPGFNVKQQDRSMFGFCYRSLLGNDVAGTAHGYTLNIVYGCYAQPSERNHQSTNESPEAVQLSWDIKTTPVECEIIDPTTGKQIKPTACLRIDSTRLKPATLKALETILYGQDPTTEDGADGVAPRLPLPEEVYTILKTAQAA